MVRYKSLIAQLIAYSLAVGSTLRYADYFRSHPSRETVALLLAAFFLLLVAEPWLSRRSQRTERLRLLPHCAMHSHSSSQAIT